MTTSENYQLNRKGVSLASLPKSFRDAVDFTRKLEIRYLWIDSLCIVQDDDEDWRRESANMDEIYQNAFLTISALNSTNCDSGLYRTALRQAHRLELVDEPGCRRNIYVRERLKHPGEYTEFTERAREAFPLMTRAWAYQERLLSPRILHFASSELIWSCTEPLRMLIVKHM